MTISQFSVRFQSIDQGENVRHKDRCFALYLWHFNLDSVTLCLTVWKTRQSINLLRNYMNELTIIFCDQIRNACHILKLSLILNTRNQTAYKPCLLSVDCTFVLNLYPIASAFRSTWCEFYINNLIFFTFKVQLKMWLDYMKMSKLFLFTSCKMCNRILPVL